MSFAFLFQFKKLLKKITAFILSVSTVILSGNNDKITRPVRIKHSILKYLNVFVPPVCQNN